MLFRSNFQMMQSLFYPQVVNFVKNENFLALRIEDLASLQTTKDKDSHSLLFHIVRKTIQSELHFSGFPGSLTEGIAAMTRLTIWRKTGLMKVEEPKFKKTLAKSSFSRAEPLCCGQVWLGCHRGWPQAHGEYLQVRSFNQYCGFWSPRILFFLQLSPFLSCWTTFTNFDAWLVNP